GGYLGVVNRRTLPPQKVCVSETRAPSGPAEARTSVSPDLPLLRTKYVPTPSAAAPTMNVTVLAVVSAAPDDAASTAPWLSHSLVVLLQCASTVLLSPSATPPRTSAVTTLAPPTPPTT